MGGRPPPPKWYPPPPDDDGRYVGPGGIEGPINDDRVGEGCGGGLLESASSSSSPRGGERRGTTTKRSAASAAADKIGEEQFRSRGLLCYWGGGRSDDECDDGRRG